MRTLIRIGTLVLAVAGIKALYKRYGKRNEVGASDTVAVLDSAKHGAREVLDHAKTVAGEVADHVSPRRTRSGADARGSAQ